MYVCVCNSVTDKQIKKSVQQGAHSIECLSEELKVATCCGKCKNCAKRVLREARKELRSPAVPTSQIPVDVVPAYA